MALLYFQFKKKIAGVLLTVESANKYEKLYIHICKKSIDTATIIQFQSFVL